MAFLLATDLDRMRAFEIETRLDEAEWLDDRQRAALRLASRISVDARAVTPAEVEAFAANWPEPDERTEIVSTIAAFSAITRIANALGVACEIPAPLRRFEPARRGALTLLGRLTALSMDMQPKPLRGRAPEENHAAIARLFGTQMGFSGLPPGFPALELCPEIFDGQLRTIEKTVCVVPRDRWMRVGLVVSKLTGCTYLAENCTRWLAQRGMDAAAVIAASEGAGSSLPDVEDACVRFARDLTLHSHTMGEDRVRELRKLGLSDGAVLDLAFVAAVFNGMTRLVGVLTPLEERVAA
jgi:alkylhydroperoxidase family enzyme